jgi:general secretion pathway protein I
LKTNNQQGFSLLEILIAFSILALSLGILLRIFSGGVNTAMVAEDYNIAVQIAESLMAKTGVESALQAEETEGVENEKYHWLVRVEPFDFNPDNLEPSKLKAVLFKISVSVVWGLEEGYERRLDLKTLKLANKT